MSDHQKLKFRAWLVGVRFLRHLTSAVIVIVLTACTGSGGAELATGTAPPTLPTSVVPPTTERAPTAPTTASTTTIAATTTSIPTIDECLAEIPLEVRLGQLLFPVLTQSELVAAAELAADGHIAGVVVIGTPNANIAADIATLQAASIVGPSIVAVDEEGGRVQRVDAIVGVVPSARSVATDLSPEAASELHRAHAVKLAELGFTMNLGPVLDLDTGTYIRNRSFSADPAVVTEYGLAVADGIAAGGLTAAAKHFPGHGRGVDSHTGLPTIPELDVLRETDLLPFATVAQRGDIPIMIGHLVVPGTTGDEPASLSREIITDLLRTELEFDGLIMTDALNMDAIALRRTGAQAAVQTLAAGSDLAMLGRLADVAPTLEAATAALADGTLDEEQLNESFMRVLETKDIEICDIPADVAPAIRCEGVTTGGCGLVSG